MDKHLSKKNCDRCGAPLTTSIMSKFNQDMLCSPCKEDERLAPNYEKADAAECAAVTHRNYNFPGIGLAPEDLEFLQKRRQERPAT